MAEDGDSGGGIGGTADAEPAHLSEAYVHSLASLGLERLQNEPGRLHSEAKAVDEALHSLSLDHYRVFIQNQECVRYVRAQGQAMEGHLSGLLSEVHGLGSEFSVFQREAAELVGGHKRNRQTLKHHMQLVELLEVPQLMDACVRSDLWEEALSIATFASTLERRHRSRGVAVVPSSVDSSNGGKNAAASAGTDDSEGHLPGVIKMIVEEVRESARGLHERLVAKLRGPVQLTSCLQVVSCLRRLELLALEERNEKKKLQQQQRQRQQEQEQQRRQAEADSKLAGGARARAERRRFSSGDGSGRGGGGGGGEVAVAASGGVSQRQLALVEMKLQVDFLEARDAWLAGAGSRAAHGDLQHALSAVHSTNTYQALMDLIESSRSQWFEVATQFRAIFLSIDGGAPGRKSPPATGERRAAAPGRSESGDVLSLWLLRRVSAFVAQLKGLLPLVEDGGSLRSLLEECMFFGASMGRLGTDFRGLLVPVFEERICGVAAGQWATASAEFVVTLRDIAAIEAAGGNGASLLYVPEKGSALRGGVVGPGEAGRAEKMGGGGEGAAGLAGGGRDGLGSPPSPPRALMAFPPVARLLNLLLTSFNQLRECLPSAVEGRLADALVLCFTDAFRGLADLQKANLRADAAAAAAATGTMASLSAQGYRGMGTPKTTARAVGLACDALAEQAVPHVALCFAVLFGENAAASAAATSAAAAAGGGKPVKMEGTKREKLQSRLLGAMETFGIYEPPPPPPPPPPPVAPPPVAAAMQSSTPGSPDAAAAQGLRQSEKGNGAVEAPLSGTKKSDAAKAAAGKTPAGTTGNASGERKREGGGGASVADNGVAVA